jgi:hypothetical protein
MACHWALFASRCRPVTAADPGWPDTVYIIDLVAAGMQQGSSSDTTSSSSSDGSSQGSSEAAAASAASDLVAGLAAVFEDPGCTLIVQDASQVRFLPCCIPRLLCWAGYQSSVLSSARWGAGCRPGVCWSFCVIGCS